MCPLRLSCSQASRPPRASLSPPLPCRFPPLSIISIPSSLPRLTKDTHVVQLVEHLRLLLLPERVLGRQERDAVDERAQVSADLVVPVGSQTQELDG